MTDKQLVEKKLRTIEQYVRELRNVEFKTFESFREDVIKKRFVERNIELSIEQMIDICRHIVSSLDLKEPETYAECFKVLGTKGIIPDGKIATFQKMVRYRNMLIHAYNGVDDSITYGIFKKQLGDFDAFIRLIRDFLLKSD
jgi:uncharacterized protein YutE (UPF0331/DUF86 family)